MGGVFRARAELHGFRFGGKGRRPGVRAFERALALRARHLGDAQQRFGFQVYGFPRKVVRVWELEDARVEGVGVLRSGFGFRVAGKVMTGIEVWYREGARELLAEEIGVAGSSAIGPAAI